MHLICYMLQDYGRAGHHEGHVRDRLVRADVDTGTMRRGGGRAARAPRLPKIHLICYMLQYDELIFGLKLFFDLEV